MRQLKFLVFFTFALFFYENALSQKITINCSNKPLNEIFFELRDEYGIEFSFNHNLVSACLITRNQTFAAIDKAISSLTKDCDFDYEYSEGTYIIFQKVEELVPAEIKPPVYFFSVQLLDALTGEPLPFSTIQTTNKGFISDVDGNFQLKSDSSKLPISFSYLGYYQLDTILFPGIKQKINLMPSLVGLDEVIVYSNAEVSNMQIGEYPGLVKLNHKLATLLPGNNNNSIYNLLRLQPGVLASAEQSGDYIIRGSFRGQNLLLFDGITLFNATSLNNEIGIVNPLIIKDIEVFKGGFNVDKGDRVGNIIQMTGNSGNLENLNGNININSQIVSASINIPIAKRFALQAAFRQSYPTIIDWNELIYQNESAQSKYYSPDYKFQDLNLKLSGQTKGGDNFYLNFLGNNDNSSFNLADTGRPRNRTWENTLDKQQLGASAFFGKNWKRHGRSSITVSYSGLSVSSYDKRFSTNRPDNPDRTLEYFRDNSIEESSIRIDHQFPVSGIHDFTVGGNLTQNKTTLFENFEGVVEAENQSISSRYSFFLIDNISLGSILIVKPGLKYDLLPFTSNSYLQPRVNLELNPNAHWRVNMAFGIYKQYITEVATTDEFNNYYYYWGLSDNSEFSVLKSKHSILGLSYKQSSLIISVEGFYKTTNNLIQVVRDSDTKRYQQSRAYGIDFYLKKDLKKHNFWIAYTLSEVKTKMQNSPNDYWHNALHNQTHEVKAAGIFNFNPWFISVNYIYGSGLTNQLINNTLTPYKRLDFAFLYKFNTKKNNLESGLSIVNVFNHNNVSYSSFSNLPDGERIYSRGMPFTPSLFLNFGF